MSPQKNQWPPNSPNLYSVDYNPIDYNVWGAMLEAYRKLKTKPKTCAELKETFPVILGQPATGTDRQGCKIFLK